MIRIGVLSPKRLIGLGVLLLCLTLYNLYRNMAAPRNINRDIQPFYPKIRYIPLVGITDTMYLHTEIPRIVHQTWKNDTIPEFFKNYVKTWIVKNPKWQYWFWTDTDIRQFISRKFPRFLSLFDAYPAYGYRIDVVRYFIMYEYGGVYADLDAECLKPLEPIREDTTCILGQEPEEHAHFLAPLGIPLVSNAVMACSAGHLFFYKVINNLKRSAGIFTWNDVLTATGPYMLTRAFRQYNATRRPERDKVTIASPSMFLPSLDNSRIDHIRDLCIDTRANYFKTDQQSLITRRLCDRIIGFDFHNEPPKEAYTDHHWTHTWAGRKIDPYNIRQHREFFNVSMLFYEIENLRDKFRKHSKTL